MWEKKRERKMRPGKMQAGKKRTLTKSRKLEKMKDIRLHYQTQKGILKQATMPSGIFQ